MSTAIAAQGSRLVDKDQNKFIKLKQAIVLGLPGTGVASMSEALKKLGCIVYDTKEVVKSHERDFGLWMECAESKAAGLPFGRNEFDKLMGRYDALVDGPAVYFTDELLKAYPDAKIIITYRDPDEWMASMNHTSFWLGLSTFSPLKLLARLDPIFFGKISGFVNTAMVPFYGGKVDGITTRQAYMDHYEKIRQQVPARRLLEVNRISTWEPLCKFLSKSIPEEPFPQFEDSVYAEILEPAKNLMVATLKPIALASLLSIMAACVAISTYLALELFEPMVGHALYPPVCAGLVVMILLAFFSIKYWECNLFARLLQSITAKLPGDNLFGTSVRGNWLTKKLVIAISKLKVEELKARQSPLASVFPVANDRPQPVVQSRDARPANPGSTQHWNRNNVQGNNCGHGRNDNKNKNRGKQHARIQSAPVARPARAPQANALGRGWANFQAEIQQKDFKQYLVNQAEVERTKHLRPQLNEEQKVTDVDQSDLAGPRKVLQKTNVVHGNKD